MWQTDGHTDKTRNTQTRQETRDKTRNTQTRQETHRQDKKHTDKTRNTQTRQETHRQDKKQRTDKTKGTNRQTGLLEISNKNYRIYPYTPNICR